MSTRALLEMAELEYDDDIQRGMTAWTRDEKDAMHRQYVDEGHFCVFLCAEDGPFGKWIAACYGCRISSAGPFEDVKELATGDDYAGLEFSTWTEAKLWARQHRAEFGLAKQDVSKIIDIPRDRPES